MGTITVELKLDLQQQQLLQQAAANRGFTLQEYLQELALNSIDDGISMPEKIELDVSDARLLNSYLEASPAANANLQTAIIEHQQKYGRW